MAIPSMPGGPTGPAPGDPTGPAPGGRTGPPEYPGIAPKSQQQQHYFARSNTSLCIKSATFSSCMVIVDDYTLIHMRTTLLKLA